MNIFVKEALKEAGRRLKEGEVSALLATYKRLIGMDVRMLSDVPTSTKKGLGHVLVLSQEKGELRFLSLASPDYKRDADGCAINIGNGKTKKEYRAPREITRRLKGLRLPFKYDVFLVDIDIEVEGKTPNEIERLLVINHKGFCEISGIKVRRLSREIDISRFESLKGDARSSGELTKQIRRLQNRTSIRVEYGITEEAIAERVIAYAALGKLLEETAPEAILADIQGRIYPFEQPFYDALRRFPLPLLRLVKM